MPIADHRLEMHTSHTAVVY